MKTNILLLIALVASIAFFLAAIESEIHFDQEDTEATDTSNLTERQLERLMMLNYEESFNRFGRSSLFYTTAPYRSLNRYRSYSFETRFIRSFLPDMRMFSEPLQDFLDYIPYRDYYAFVDQYYLSDIMVLDIKQWGDIRINVKDLTQGDYFLKINLFLFRSQRDKP
jgi:hypothetical protein